MQYLTGDTPDISFLAEFGFFDFVWFISPEPTTKTETKRIGLYLGPSINVGEAMSGIVVTANLERYSRTSIFPVTDADRANPHLKSKMSTFKRKMNAELERLYKDGKRVPDYIPDRLAEAEFPYHYESELTPEHCPYCDG